MQTVSEPKGARKKNAFATRQSINLFFLRSISKHEAILHKLAFNRLNSAAHTLISGRQKASHWHQEQTRVERVRPIKLRERFLARVVTAFADFRVDLIANFLPALEMFVCRAATFLNKFDRAIERDPGHHFRMRKMFAAATYLPHSFVQFLPI